MRYTNKIMRYGALFSLLVLSAGALFTSYWGSVWLIEQQFPPPHTALKLFEKDLKYGGPLIDHSLSPQQITLAVTSEHDGHSIGKQRFIYDAATEWYSVDFTFRDGIVTERKIEEEKPQPMPVGTYVIVQRDRYSDNPSRAAGIMIVRRTNL